MRGLVDFLIEHRGVVLVATALGFIAVMALAWTLRSRRSAGRLGFLKEPLLIGQWLEPRRPLFERSPHLVHVTTEAGVVPVCAATIALRKGASDVWARALGEVLEYASARSVRRVLIEMPPTMAIDRLQLHWLHALAYELSGRGGVLTVVFPDDLPAFHPWRGPENSLPYYRVAASVPLERRLVEAAARPVLAVEAPGAPVDD